MKVRRGFIYKTLCYTLCFVFQIRVPPLKEMRINSPVGDCLRGGTYLLLYIVLLVPSPRAANRRDLKIC